MARSTPATRHLGLRTFEHQTPGFESCGWCRIHTQEVSHNWGREGKCSIGYIGCIGSFLLLVVMNINTMTQAARDFCADEARARSISAGIRDERATKSARKSAAEYVTVFMFMTT